MNELSRKLSGNQESLDAIISIGVEEEAHIMVEILNDNITSLTKKQEIVQNKIAALELKN